MRQPPSPLIVENSPALTVPLESIPARPTTKGINQKGESPSTAGGQTATGETGSAVASGEVTYICGAKTKSGTPCTRKVHGNVRCYQHKGQPAMLPPEQLVVKK
jgi:hypothetical protein